MVPKSNVVHDITYNNVYDIAYDNVSDVVFNVGIFNRVDIYKFLYLKMKSNNDFKCLPQCLYAGLP